MKPNPIATRALAGMLPAMALFATPVLAQEAAQPAAPPPPVVVVPPVAAEPAAPAASAGPSAEDRAKMEASATAATGAAASAAAGAPAAETRAETRRAPARPAARTASAPARAATTPAAPVAAAPVAPTQTAPAAAPATPTAAASQPAAPMTTPIPDEPAAAAPATTETTTETTTTESGGVPTWAWVLGAIAILGAIAAFVAMRRRRQDDTWEEAAVYEEPAYVEPVAAAPVAAAPLAAAPIAHDVVAEDHAEVATPAADEVAAITAASAPVTGRPWIELSLRPLRAGATDDSAIVDLELTLANAGEVEARDVRVSTFMLGDAGAAPSDMDRLLASGNGGTQVNAGEIGAGEGSRVDATLALPREGLDGATFQPIVVADVRYTLPDGGEGRTAAAFAVGVDDGTDAPTPLRLGGDMREDVAATLHGVLERA